MKLLVVEDELAQRQILETELAKLDYQIVGVETGAEAVAQLAKRDFDLVVTDLKLPDFDGIEVIRRTRASGNEVPILVMTAYASVESAISALRVGATDYLIKPIRIPELTRRLQQIYDLDRLKRENRLLKRMIQQETKGYWCPETPAGLHLSHLISKVANTDLTVLVTGASGTGKGMTARHLHSVGNRADGPFVSLNCSVTPDHLMESEVFGHTRGAFEGASSSQDGLFVVASAGTLFVDEIENLTLPMQAKILQAIEEKAVRPVGSTAARPVDVRLIAAANRDLETMAAEGTFREDLLSRLTVFRISLPPLSSQMEALPSAVDHFLTKHVGRAPERAVRIASEAWKRFATYDWPGNLRELGNTIERALVLCERGLITVADLPPALQFSQGATPSTTHGTLKERVEAFERTTILQTIEMIGGDRRRVAEALGIGLSTLYRKLEDPARDD
jgi:two-component system response regulator AtoC